MDRPQLAVVRAEFTVVNPELLMFSDLVNFQTRFCGYAERDTEWVSSPEFTRIAVSKQKPEIVTSRVTRRPYSPASLVKLATVEPLRNAEFIETAETYSSISYQCAKVAKRQRKKLVVSVWETLSGISVWRLPPYAFNVRGVKLSAHLFIAHTKRAAAHIRGIGVPEEKIRLIYPGIDVSKFSPANASNHEGLRILYMGRFDREKGLASLLEAFSYLCRERKDVELWIRAKKGTGKLEGLAREYARHLPIKFVSRSHYSDLPKLYGECDFLCLPSIERDLLGLKVWEEQFGFVLIEAMACGLPVIATECGAIPEVVGRNNILVPQNSPQSLFRELRRLCEDERLRSSLSRDNRGRVESEFNLEKQRSLTERTLLELR